MSMKQLAIYGSGGFGHEVYDIAQRANAAERRWEKIVFIDDFREEGSYRGTQVFHFDTILKEKSIYEAVVALGEPSSREKLFRKLLDNGIEAGRLVDPTALVSPSAQIGPGTIICEFASVHCDVVIGRNCVVQPYSDIGHDIRIGDHCVFSPHFAPGGHSVYGDRVYTGMHASLKENLTIGNDAVIAMGAAVFRDVPEGAVVVGNPARITRGNEEGKVFKS